MCLLTFGFSFFVVYTLTAASCSSNHAREIFELPRLFANVVTLTCLCVCVAHSVGPGVRL